MVKQLSFPLKKAKQTGQHSTPALSSPFTVTPVLEVAFSVTAPCPPLAPCSQGEAPSPAALNRKKPMQKIDRLIVGWMCG